MQAPNSDGSARNLTASAEDLRPEREFTDLGFGTVVAQQARGRFLSHDGEPTGRKYSLGPQRLAHAYLAALNAS